MMTQQQSPSPVPPTLPMSVQLEAQQWNGVLAALSDAPYRMAAPIIDAITQQLGEASRAHQGPPPMPGIGVGGGVGNGVDHASQPPPEGVHDRLMVKEGDA